MEWAGNNKREEVYLEYIKMIEKIVLMMYNMTINKTESDRMVIHAMKKFNRWNGMTICKAGNSRMGHGVMFM